MRRIKVHSEGPENECILIEISDRNIKIVYYLLVVLVLIDPLKSIGYIKL